MGGGPSSEQKNAANAQTQLSQQQAAIAGRQQDFFEQQQKLAQPFFQSRMQNGLPYMNQLTDAQSGINARAFAPARQQLMQRLGQYQGLPSGYRDQSLTDLDSQQARSFDSGLLGALQANEQTKEYGAAGLSNQQQLSNPMGYFGGAMGANQSLMNAPLQRPGMAGLFGGLAGGLASAIPF